MRTALERIHRHVAACISNPQLATFSPVAIERIAREALRSNAEKKDGVSPEDRAFWFVLGWSSAIIFAIVAGHLSKP